VPVPNIVPANLIRLREPFDSAEYVFELKMDGFRALEQYDGRRELLDRTACCGRGRSVANPPVVDTKPVTDVPRVSSMYHSGTGDDVFTVFRRASRA
jgi:hypothetical protein